MSRVHSLPLRRWLPIFIGGIFALQLLAAIAWNFHHETNSSQTQAKNNLAFTLAEAQSSLEALLRNKAQGKVAEQIALFGSPPEVQKLALIDGDGIVRYSAQRQALGQSVAKVLAEFSPTDMQRALSQHSLVISLSADHHYLLAYQPIRLSSTAKQIRAKNTGILLLKYNLSIAQAHALDRVVTSGLVSLLIVSMLMIFMMLILHRWFTQPLAQLLAAVKRIGEGDVEASVEVLGHGEMADLGHALNRMQCELSGANNTIRESELRYRTLVEHSPLCIHEVDLEGRLTSMNAAGLSMMNLANQCQIQGMSYMACVGESDQNRIAELLAKAYSGVGSTFSFKASGSQEKYFQSCFVPINNDDGIVIKLMGVANDITIRELAEQALRRAESQAQLMLAQVQEAKGQLDKTQELAKLGSWVLDLEKNRLSWSDEVYRLFGLVPQDGPMSYESFLQHVHPDDRALVDTVYADSVKNGTDGYDIEHRIIHASSGEVRYVHERCEHVKDAAGKVVRSLGMVHDITELNQTQLALQSSFAELSFQKLALDEHAIVSIANIKGDITYVNDKFCEISGYSREELMGQNHRLLRSDEHSQAFFKHFWRTIASGKTWQGEIKNLNKSGTIYWVASTIVPLLNAAGKPVQYISIRTDITHVKSTETLLRRSQKMESIGELAGGIAHDFNNLLGIIIGNLDLISRKLESGSKLHKQLTSAHNAALRGASMTRRLLDFSRHSNEAHSPVNIGKVVYEFEEFIQKSLTASISTEIHRANEVWLVELNPDEFEDALVNLSLNARDAMPTGGKLIIEVSNILLDSQFMASNHGLEPGEYVKVSVSDTGTGMSKEVAEKIFDPFFTTKNKGEGTGLGLAMVYGFVKRSGGHIDVYSEADMGTTVSMYLPRAMNRDKRAGGVTEITASQPMGSETILIVDDEVVLAAIAKIILDELGYTTICAHSAHEAQQIIENHSNIDLVFTDIVMPGGMSGLDLADVISKQYPSVKVLLTSGFTGKVNHGARVQELIRKMLQKPYRGSELAQRVRDTLDDVY